MVLRLKKLVATNAWLDFKIICVNMLVKNFMKTGGIKVKQHKFWAWAAIVCFVMLLYTGYTHK